MLRLMLRVLPGLVLLLLFASVPARGEESPQPDPQVVIKTSEGDITLRLFPDKSPVTVANFLAYVDAGHYNGTIFHRVIPGFMIQGGGFLPDLTEKPTGDPIVNESRNRLHNIRGTVTMARTSDPDSAAAQFFINQRTNLRLDWSPGQEGYTVFGEVIDGMPVVDYISSTPVHTVAGHEDVPTEPILILSVERKAQP